MTVAVGLNRHTSSGSASNAGTQRTSVCTGALRARRGSSSAVASVSACDAAHFSRAFQQRFGTTPRAYRQRHGPAAGAPSIRATGR